MSCALANDLRNDSMDHGPTLLQGGFFGVGIAEALVIGLLSWFLLGPRELFRIAKRAGAWFRAEHSNDDITFLENFAWWTSLGMSQMAV